MGLLSGLLGNASEVDVAKVEDELERIVIDGERVERAFKIVRDLMIFTDRRLILIDKQGMTGKKVQFHSIPYHSISHFAVETKGRFDTDAEMKIFISSWREPLVYEFSKDDAILEVQRTLASYVLD